MVKKRGGRRVDSKLCQRMKKKGFYMVSETAEKAGVHRATVYRWINDGHVKFVHVNGTYFVSYASLVAWYGDAAKVLDMTT